MSAEVDRKGVKLHESNELSLYETDEAKLKHIEVLVMIKQLNYELKLKLSVEIERKRVKLHESNELSRYERVEANLNRNAPLVVRQ